MSKSEIDDVVNNPPGYPPQILSQNPPPYPTQGPGPYPSTPAYDQYPPQYTQYPQQSVRVVYTSWDPYTGNHYGSTPTGRPWHSETVKDNVVLSIFSIFCCFVLGLIATVKAYESREHVFRGDFPAASASSNFARRCAVAAIVIGICVFSSIVFVRLWYVS